MKPMERRKAPSSYARQTFIAFEVAGAIGGGVGVGLVALMLFFWPNAPIWAFSLALGAGFILFVVLLVRMRPKFKCPQCGQELGRDAMVVQGTGICFVCANCQVEWDSGMKASGGE